MLRPTTVAMVTKICKFQHKNGYNSDCIRCNPDTSAPGRGHSESAHLRCQTNLLRPTLLSW